MRLVVIMVHIFPETGWADLHVLAIAVMLSQVADHETLSRSRMDIDEVGQDAVGAEHDQSHDEPVCVVCPTAGQDEVADYGHHCG